MIKLSKAATLLQVHKNTIVRWETEGKISLHRTSTNRIYVNEADLNKITLFVENEKEGNKSTSPKKCAIYARVSSGDRKSEAETQKQRCISYAISNGYQVVSVITEIASGLNDKRPKLQKLLESNEYDILLVEHKDRLTRFGFNYINVLIQKTGKVVEVINLTDDNKRDLIDDFISIITSFCARIYGNRRSTRKAQQILNVVLDEETDSTKISH